jgi:hypothetical protein
MEDRGIEQAPAPRRERPLVTLGAVGAFILAFALGALSYRELVPTTVTYAAAAKPVAVAGQASPPSWITLFAKAFCDADAERVAARVGGSLAAEPAAIAEAFAQREWDCAEQRYLGGGGSGEGVAFYVYALKDGQSREQWWVFTVSEEQVVRID